MEARFRTAAVDLAEAPDFRIGALRVSPSTRPIEDDSDARTLEPRVMQVLVALHEEAGRVVSRDALVERCWDGVIVGDNAINRVISRLRQLAQESGAFTIETIPRVGYRLTEAVAVPPAPAKDQVHAIGGGQRSATFRADRRWLFAGGAAALAVASLALLGRGRPPTSDQEALRLVEEAHILRESGVSGAGSQALLLLEQAVAISPESAEAWGALALTEALGPRPAGDAEAADVSARARNAAERALALDPGNADASDALAICRNWIGRWTAHEKDLRAVVAQHPAHVEARAGLAFFLCQAGRWADALPIYAALAKEQRLPTGSHGMFAAELSARGNRMEADRVLSEAVKRWPRHRGLWAARFEYLVAAGRVADARATVTDRTRFEIIHPTLPIDIGLAIADALEGRPGAPARDSAAEQILAARAEGKIFSGAAARMLVLLGQPGPALAIVRAYLLGGVSPGGRVFPPPPPEAKRRTEFLFLPSTALLRAEPGLAEIVQAIGLGRHWQETGTGPQLVD